MLLGIQSIAKGVGCLRQRTFYLSQFKNMRDKTIINIPVFRTKPMEIENNLFPPTKPSMITEVIQKVDSFQCSQANNIIVENTGKNYNLNYS